jgi:hypothetical protein
MGLSLHWTTIWQKLQKDCEQKLLNYQQYNTNLRKTGNCMMEQIANAEETAINLYMLRNHW